MANTRTKIMDVGEDMLRGGGYHGFSFRTIAAEIGIKSSSVHHHFATKEVLTHDIVQRYMSLFMAALGKPAPAGATTQSQVHHYGSVFKASYDASGHGCLCGVLSNERELLPPSILSAVDSFVDQNVAWLVAMLGLNQANTDQAMLEAQATAIYCAMQGALTLTALREDGAYITAVANVLQAVT